MLFTCEACHKLAMRRHARRHYFAGPLLPATGSNPDDPANWVRFDDGRDLTPGLVRVAQAQKKAA